MRLRSSQLVFLLLLACSVQVGEEFPVRLIAGTLYACSTVQTHDVASQTPPASYAAGPANAERAPKALGLAPDAVAAQRVAWEPRRAVQNSAALVSHTSFRRA